MVFITIVTYQRNKLLLNYADLIKQALLYTKTKYKFIIIAYVIIEDHIHLILKPEIIEDYPNIIKTFPCCSRAYTNLILLSFVIHNNEVVFIRIIIISATKCPK